MIYKIYYEGERKFALPIKNREQLMKLRNAKANLRNLATGVQFRTRRGRYSGL